MSWAANPQVVPSPLQRQFSVHRICRRAFLLLLSSFAAVSSAFAAGVIGVVTNTQGGEPLAKIQVALLGTTMATVSGSDGRFHFSQLPAGSYVLQVSGVGYRSSTVSPNQCTSLANTEVVKNVPECNPVSLA